MARETGESTEDKIELGERYISLNKKSYPFKSIAK